MKYQTFARLALAALLISQTAAFAAEGERGFKSIFNGTDLAGWDGNPKCWSVRDGAITGETSVERITHNTFLIWTNGWPVGITKEPCPSAIRKAAWWPILSCAALSGSRR